MTPDDRADARVDPIVAELARLRGERGWTLRELARRAGISDRAIGCIESGRNGATLYTLRAVAAAFGLTVDLRPTETAQDRRRRQWREYKQRQRARPQSVHTAVHSSAVGYPQGTLDSDDEQDAA